MARSVSCLALVATIFVAGCVAEGPPSTPTGTGASGAPSLPAVAPPSADVSPSGTPSDSPSLPPAVLDPSTARWTEIGKVGRGPATGGAVSDLIAFDGGYVGVEQREPFQEPVAWMSTNGRSWDVTSLANWVRNCPGYGPEGDEDVPDADVAAIATNGRQVIVVGAENPHTAATCADVTASIRPIAWVSGDGRTWRRSAPFYAAGPNGRATAVWAAPDGWQAVAESPVKGMLSLWQSADGLSWKDVGKLADVETMNVYAGAAANGSVVLSRYVEGDTDLFMSTDGRTWEPIDAAGGCEKGATQIEAPASPGLGAWVLLSGSRICTSVDLATWATEELPMAVWRLAQTRFGAIALGDTCYGAGVDCPDPGMRAYVTADGATWSRFDHPKAYYGRLVADGPAGVLMLGTRPNDPGWPSVWLLDP